MINGELSFLWFHERQPGTGHSGVWELNYGSMGTSWLCLDSAGGLRDFVSSSLPGSEMLE